MLPAGDYVRVYICTSDHLNVFNKITMHIFLCERIDLFGIIRKRIKTDTFHG